jgi:hypothetical protein
VGEKQQGFLSPYQWFPLVQLPKKSATEAVFDYVEALEGKLEVSISSTSAEVRDSNKVRECCDRVVFPLVQLPQKSATSEGAIPGTTVQPFRFH